MKSLKLWVASEISAMLVFICVCHRSSLFFKFLIADVLLYRLICRRTYPFIVSAFAYTCWTSFLETMAERIAAMIIIPGILMRKRVTANRIPSEVTSNRNMGILVVD